MLETITATPTMEGSEGVLAIVFHAIHEPVHGVTFMTPPHAPMQAAYISRRKGDEIDYHRHPPQTRVVHGTSETIIVKCGKVMVSLFTSIGQHERDVVLGAGDLIILYAGGHGFTFLEDSELFEVKQGPYDASKDKIYYSSIR
jgi:hypothetical protein